MKVLVIYAHPNKESFNGAVLDNIQHGLESGKHEYKILDLYAEEFDPVLKFSNHEERKNLHNDSATKKYRDLVTEAEHVIFIYPVWWYGPPAILKGFIDRVFVTGFAYTNVGRIPKGLLTNKTAWVITTTGSPKWYTGLFRLNADWFIMKRAVLKFVGFKKVKRMAFGNITSAKLSKRKKWLLNLYLQAKDLHKFNNQ